LSGLGQVLGTAVKEDPATGETTLRLGFSLSKFSGRSGNLGASQTSDSVATNGTKLSLRALLHYLWDQAELTRWQPGFAGKRSWATVRKHLLQAAQNKTARGGALQERLYVPEVFYVEQRDVINARRIAHWRLCTEGSTTPGKAQRLMLLIAEVKEIVPSRYGYKAVIKHLPDQAFALDEQLYRRMARRFQNELAMWGAADKLRMLMIATFAVSESTVPTIVELSLMLATQQWLPIENGYESQLVERLVAEERSFIKGLRYNLQSRSAAAATLTDCQGSAPFLFIAPMGSEGGEPFACMVGEQQTSVWRWCPQDEKMPLLPMRRPYRGTTGQSTN
jgi:hypothetical protein